MFIFSEGRKCLSPLERKQKQSLWLLLVEQLSVASNFVFRLNCLQYLGVRITYGNRARILCFNFSSSFHALFVAIENARNALRLSLTCFSLSVRVTWLCNIHVDKFTLYMIIQRVLFTLQL